MSPSLRLSPSERTKIFQHFLEESLEDDLDALNHIFSTPYNVTENEEIVIQSSFEHVNQQLGIYKLLTVDLPSKEASGRALMGVIIFELAHAIRKKNPIFHLNVNYEYRFVSSRHDYATAVVAIFLKGVSTAFISLLLSIDLFIFPPRKREERSEDR